MALKGIILCYCNNYPLVSQLKMLLKRSFYAFFNIILILIFGSSVKVTDSSDKFMADSTDTSVTDSSNIDQSLAEIERTLAKISSQISDLVQMAKYGYNTRFCGENGTASEDLQFLVSHPDFGKETFDNTYSPFYDCVTTITAPIGKRIELRFIFVHVESDWTGNCGNDYIKIDGVSKICGEFPSNFIKPDNFVTPTNSIQIKFHTNGLYQFKGFKIAYLAV